MIKSRKPGQAFPSRKRKESLEKGQKYKKDFSEKKINRKKKDPSAHKSLMIRNSLEIDSYRKHATRLSETSCLERGGEVGWELLAVGSRGHVTVSASFQQPPLRATLTTDR